LGFAAAEGLIILDSLSLQIEAEDDGSLFRQSAGNALPDVPSPRREKSADAPATWGTDPRTFSIVASARGVLFFRRSLRSR